MTTIKIIVEIKPGIYKTQIQKVSDSCVEARMLELSNLGFSCTCN